MVLLEGVGEASLSTCSLATPRRRSTCDGTTMSHTITRPTSNPTAPPSALRRLRTPRCPTDSTTVLEGVGDASLSDRPLARDAETEEHVRWHRYVTHGHKAGYTYKPSSVLVRTQMVAAPLSCVLNHRFRAKHARGEAPSPTARSRRRDGGARTTASRRRAQVTNRLQPLPPPCPSSCALGAALVGPPPHVSRSTRWGAVFTFALAGPRRRRTRNPTAASSTITTRTTSPAAPRTAQGRPRTPTWSSRSKPWTTMAGAPAPRVIACMSF